MKLRSQSQMPLPPASISFQVLPVSGISSTLLCPCPTYYPHGSQCHLDFEKDKTSSPTYLELHPFTVLFTCCLTPCSGLLFLLATSYLST